jgi:hypothetical protein
VRYTDEATPAQHRATDDKHGNILGSCLDDDADEGHERRPEDGRSATKPIREDAGHREAKDLAYVDRRRVQSCGCGSELEVARVDGEGTACQLALDHR